MTNSRKSGLTLIELLVVLTILIALGGIVISSLPGLLKRTQSATAAANVPEIDSAIRRKLITDRGLLGNRFDSLVSGAGTSGSIPEYVGGADFLEGTDLSPAEVEALKSLGITELIPATESVGNATFDSHQQQPVVLGSGAVVCSVAATRQDAVMERLWNIAPGQPSRYLVFGVGSRCTLVGGSESALFPEAPVHFSEQANSSPQNMYSRYLIVVELKPASELQARARFVGVAIPGPAGLHGISEELKEIYSEDG